MEPMGFWSIIHLITLILSLMFPISLAGTSSVKPDHDTSLAIQQIQQCLPSCSAGEPSQDHAGSSASVRQAGPSATNDEVNIGDTPPPISDTQNQRCTRDIPQLSTSTSTSTSNPFQSQFITPHGGPPRDHVIEIDDGQQSGQAITMETTTQTQYPRRGSSEPSISLTTTRSNYLQSQFQTQNPSLRTGHGHLPDQLNNIHETPSDQPFKLGKVFLGLTFQAAVAFMIFHFQGPSASSSSPSQSPLSPSSSSNPPSISFDILMAAMAIGFTCTLIGILFRNAYPNAASFVEYVGIFSSAFGFFTMMEMFLPENFSWTVWPTGVLLLVLFFFVLAKMG